MNNGDEAEWAFGYRSNERKQKNDNKSSLCKLQKCWTYNAYVLFEREKYFINVCNQ